MGLASASWKHCFPHSLHKLRKARKPRTRYLQYSESQVSTSWGQENGLADVYIYIQWNPGKCTNIVCSTVPAARHWSDPWYLWKKDHRKWEGLPPAPWICVSFTLNIVSTGDIFFWHRGIKALGKRREIKWKNYQGQSLDWAPWGLGCHLSQLHTQLPAQGLAQNRN